MHAAVEQQGPRVIHVEEVIDVHRLGLVQRADDSFPNSRVCASFMSNCVLKQQTCVPDSTHRLGNCAQVVAYLQPANGFIVAALLHPFMISSTLFLLSPLDLVDAAIFLSKLSVGPFVCSLLTFGCFSSAASAARFSGSSFKVGMHQRSHEAQHTSERELRCEVFHSVSRVMANLAALLAEAPFLAKL